MGNGLLVDRLAVDDETFTRILRNFSGEKKEENKMKGRGWERKRKRIGKSKVLFTIYIRVYIYIFLGFSKPGVSKFNAISWWGELVHFSMASRCTIPRGWPVAFFATSRNARVEWKRNRKTWYKSWDYRK